MPVDYDEFKGYKLIVLKRTPEDNYPFKFGKSKAQLIVDNADAIKAFAAEEEKQTKSNP
ncbi:hypothetical protein GF352_01025 [archaeon]|nr:hypothetical protein [archaeon]